MTNFAKWYAFNRTRVLAMQTAGGIAFSALSEQNARVGFHTLWENGSATAGFLNITPFDLNHKAIGSAGFTRSKPDQGTPLPDAIYRIGEYFSGNFAASGLPGAAEPLDATTGRCQPNYHLLSTDGYWNAALTSSVGDWDGTVGVPRLVTAPGPGLHARKRVSAPLLRGADGDQQHARRPCDEVLDHRLAFCDFRQTIALMTSRTPSHRGSTSRSMASRSAPRGPSFTLPASMRSNPAQRTGPQRRAGVGGPDAIDDLWHAALNSRGKFFNADDRAATGGERRQRAVRLHRSQRYRHRHRARGSANIDNQELWLPGELRLTVVGGRQEIRPRPGNRRPARRQQTEIRSTSPCGRPRTNSINRYLARDGLITAGS